MAGSNNLFYIWGGSMSPDELWSYDITTNSWTQLQDGTGTGIVSPERDTAKGPAMGGLSHSPLKLYFFGPSGSFPTENDLWSYALPDISTTSTPSPSPSPSPASVVGDPVSYFGGKRFEFVLPPCMSLLLKMPDMELWGQPFYGLMGEQWIERLSIRSGAQEVAMVKIKPDIALFESKRSTPNAFATMDFTIPEIDPEPLPWIPRPCHYIHSSGLTISCHQGRYLGTSKSSNAPPREAVMVVGRWVSLLITSSSAFEYYMNGPLAAQHAHLDLDFVDMKNESSFTGLLPEVWGLQPMSDDTARLLKWATTTCQVTPEVATYVVSWFLEL